jgi:hypothetical protein
MLDFFASKRSKDETPKATASVQSLSGSQLSGSEPRSEQEQPENTESGKKTNLFSRLLARPFTRRRITILGGLIFFILALLVLVITLPIVLTRAHKHKDPGDVYHLYSTKHDDPSYRIVENKPVYAIHNFPDPGLLNHNGTWYAYGTNPHKHDPQSIHIPVATSTDFVNWTLHEGYDAMPTLGNWEMAVNHWAPDVIERVSSRSSLLKHSGIPESDISYRMMENSFFTTPAKRTISINTTASEQRSRTAQIPWVPLSPSMNPWPALTNMVAPLILHHSEMQTGSSMWSTRATETALVAVDGAATASSR